jgi:membrane-bound metal-dependent hydrolase YbcI (DUF457 family)
MPTIVTHAFVATLLAKSFAVSRLPARFWVVSVLCVVLPDADVLSFPLGISYEDMLGHRGLSHSLEPIVLGQSQQVVHPVRLAPGHQFVARKA